MGARQLSCTRDGTPTLLTCAACNDAICPKCFVRTEVGLRCPDCAVGSPVHVAARRPRWAIALVPTVVLVLALIAVALRSGDSRPAAAAGPEPSLSYRVVDRPDIGFAVELPPSWTARDDPASGSAFYAQAPSGMAWMRVFKAQTELPLDQSVDNAVAQLQRQGGMAFVRQPSQVGGLSAVSLDFMLPLSPMPGAAVAPRRWYLVKRGSVEFTLALGTTDLERDQVAFVRIAASFLVL